MKYLILFFPLFISFSHVSGQSIIVTDYVAVVNDNHEEAYFFYQNNWAKFRQYALDNGFISGFSLQKDVSPANDYDLVLQTFYPDSTDLANIEAHFTEWNEKQSGAKFLNENRPYDFRKIVRNDTRYSDVQSFRMGSTVSSTLAKKEARAFDFWLGRWHVTDSLGNHLGDNEITILPNGSGLQEFWVSGRGANTGTSLNFYDSQSGFWYQTWISSTGNPLFLKGNPQNDSMIMFSDSTQFPFHRISWKLQNDGVVVQSWDTKLTKESPWTNSFKGYYHPKN